MTLLEIINRINRLEEVKSFVSFRLKDIDLWPLFRINIYAKFHASYYAEKEDKGIKHTHAKSIFDSVFRKILFILNFIKDFDVGIYYLSKKDVLLLSDGVSFIPHNNSYIDKLCYPIEEYLTQNKYKVATIVPKGFYNKVFSLQKLLRINSFVSLLDVLFRFKSPISKKERENLSDVILKINNSLEGEYLAYTSVLSSINHILTNIIVFQYVLKKTKPNVVFVVEYYSTQGLAMVFACKKLGVKCVDLQHGAAYSTHPAYSHWNNTPANHYNTMPDGFFVWSHAGKEIIKNWYKGKIYLGTNIYFDQSVRGSLKSENNSASEYSKLVNDKRKRILVSLQTGIFTVNQIYVFLKNNLWTKNYFWLVRLHPGMMAESQSATVILNEFDNVDIANSSKYILSDVLKVTDLHITHCSSTSLEAALFSVPSIVLDYSGVELCEGNIHPEKFTYVKGISNLTDKVIIEMLNISSTTAQAKDKSKERLQRAYKAIDEIMGDDF